MNLGKRGVLIVNEKKHEWIKTSITGEYILKLLKDPMSYLELLNNITCYYEVCVEDIEEIILKTLLSFYSHNIITIDGESNNNEPQYIVNENNELQQIWLNITNRCNYSCPQCFSKIDNADLHLSLQIVEDLMLQASELSVTDITISGGEPSLHPNFVDIVKAVKNNNIPVKVITNGTIVDLNSEILNQLRYYVDDVQISFDGICANTHDQIRGIGAFEKALNALKFFKDGNARVGIGFTPLLENISELENLYDFGFLHEVDYLHISRPSAPSNVNYCNKEEFLSERFFGQVIDQVSKLREREQRFREMYRAMERKYPMIYASFIPHLNMIDNVKKERCSAGITTISIMEDGEVYPCVSMSTNRKKELSCGNIYSAKLKDIHVNARNKMIQSFSVNDNKDCKKCIFKFFCGGGCRSTGNNIYDHDSSCSEFKKRYVQFVKNISLTNVRALSRKNEQ